MAHTLLIVDDHREILNLLTIGLESLGHDFEIKNALSGEEALLEAQFNPIDLLISDVSLPGISGLELVKSMQKINPDVQVIMLTGRTALEIRQEFMDLGVSDYFVKPVEITDLLDTITRSLGLEVMADSDAVPEPTENMSISQRLALLRHEINGISVSMLNEHGQFVYQAGDLVDAEIESTWMPTIMSAFSAGNRLGLLLGEKTPNQLQIFHGTKYDLALLPVSASHVLLAVTRQPLVSEKAGQFSEIMYRALGQLNQMMGNLGVEDHLENKAESPLPDDEALVSEETGPIETDSELAALLEKKQDPAEADLDGFWDQDEGVAAPGTPNADSLSFEQARQLGLTPDNDD